MSIKFILKVFFTRLTYKNNILNHACQVLLRIFINLFVLFFITIDTQFTCIIYVFTRNLLIFLQK